MDNWMEDVRMQDLSESQRKFAEVIGVRATVRLCEAFAGEQVYIPKNDALRKTLRDRDIRKLYTRGWTVKQIARKYGMAEPYVHTLVSDVRPEQIHMELEL